MKRYCIEGTQMENPQLQSSRRSEIEPAFFERMAMTLERLALRFARLSGVDPSPARVNASR